MAKLEAKQKGVKKPSPTDRKERTEPALHLLGTQPTVLKAERQKGVVTKVGSAVVSLG